MSAATTGKAPWANHPPQCDSPDENKSPPAQESGGGERSRLRRHFVRNMLRSLPTHHPHGGNAGLGRCGEKEGFSPPSDPRRRYIRARLFLGVRSVGRWAVDTFVARFWEVAKEGKRPTTKVEVDRTIDLHVEVQQQRCRHLSA